MGQLEKYGLYVLCLVIFLILGVAIWGGGDVPVQRPQSAVLEASGRGPKGGNPSEATLGGDKLLDIFLTEEEKPKVQPPGGGAPPVAKGELVPDPEPKTEPRTEPRTEPGKEPPPPVRTTHVIVRGDTFDSIARKLGSPKLIAELVRLNPKVDARTMQLGTEILLPTPAEIDRVLGAGKKNEAAPVAAGTRSYVIAQGDTLEGIARRELRDHRRRKEIERLNPGLDARSLKIGRSILLPAK